MRVLFLALLLHPIQKICTEVKLPPYHLSNCVQSMIVVLQQSTTIKFTQKDLKEVHINYPDALVMRQQNDPRIKGVVYNLVRRGIATEVKINKLQAGDIVQFWNKDWGHCGIVKGVNYPKRLLWMYSSMPVTNFSLTAFPFPAKFYACRIKTQYLKTIN